ncbi:MAG: class I SAM-dependent methyltransferase [Saprospiraceae bacterium]|jgi:SAM-dependent methyltransferase|nr:class I SAM-dependent methyltransferase [Saprospiraceae bacterium]MBX7178352.1 class I SAM-dependent methyltransferase [Saprospiraceae bacterium]MCB0591607.1 class I SAM-dependent methyltransferase [Saprospiraceae bacterium]MCO5283294.1 class I SAM-dependent methyltransferase [Saprospiraceae bacterium]MCO6471583.1 class I SAM-dependent methyltransferase [Saprospiraceae bacterium]
MLEFHSDIKTYFNIQYLTSRDHIIPYLSQFMDTCSSIRVLEVGCGEAGVLKAFLERGHDCTGIELEQKRIESARELFRETEHGDRIKFIVKNIYDIDPQRDNLEPFDLIILKDVIEHIPDQEKIIPELKKLSKPGGTLFFAFPPWYMPFGGHQQILRSKILSKIPWIHLLPGPLYRSLLQMAGEAESTVKELMELKATGISIERFNAIARQHFNIIDTSFWLINPIYEYKFKLRTRKVPGFLTKLPFFRNFYTTAAYFTLRNDK